VAFRTAPLAWVFGGEHLTAWLLLPWLALVAFVSALWLPLPWRIAVLAAAGFFLALAAFDASLRQGSALKRITSPARTVLVMLAASFCSISVFLVSPQRLWKRTRVGAEKPEH